MASVVSLSGQTKITITQRQNNRHPPLTEQFLLIEQKKLLIEQKFYVNWVLNDRKGTKKTGLPYCSSTKLFLHLEGEHPSFSVKIRVK